MISFLPPLRFGRTVTSDRRSPRTESARIWGGAAQKKRNFEFNEIKFQFIRERLQGSSWAAAHRYTSIVKKHTNDLSKGT
jgi:hypothetical protein